MNPTKITNSRSKALSLVEVVLVLAVLIVMLSISSYSLNSARETQEFNNDFEQLQSFLNNARSMAIAAKGQNGIIDITSGVSGPTIPATPANYGVNFKQGSVSSPSSIILFADNNLPETVVTAAKKKFDNGATCTALALGCDLVMKEYQFKDKFELAVFKGDTSSKVDEDGSGVPITISGNPSIFYSPLYADVAFEGAAIAPEDPDYPFIIIRLQESTGPQRCRQIAIHFLAGNPEVSTCVYNQV